LALTGQTGAIVVPPKLAKRIRALGRLAGRPQRELEGRSFKAGFRFHVGNGFGFERASQLSEVDRDANLEMISQAARRAEIVAVSIHAHDQGRWLREFAVDSIERGADVVLVTGPHEVRGVQLHRGKPIFYSMGSMAFEIEAVERLPSEAYERLGLGDDASPDDVFAAAKKGELKLLNESRSFEGVAAVLGIAGGRISRIRLIPIDLQLDETKDRRGRPRIAPPELGKRIIDRIATLSRRHGTDIRYDAAANRGEIEIP